MEKILNAPNDFSLRKVAIYLIFFIPVSLVIGPLIAEICIFLINIIFFYLIFKEKNFSIFKKNYFHYFLLLWIFLIFSSLISDFLTFSLKSSFFYIRFGIFYLSVCYFFKDIKKVIKLKKIIYIIFFFILLLLFDAFFQKIFSFNILGIEETKNRVSSFFGDELVLGSFIARLLPTIFAILFLFNNKSIIKLLPYIWLISIVVVIFSGEKTAFALILISTLFIIFFNLKNLKSKLIALSILFTFIFGLFYFLPNLQTRIIKNYITNSADGKYLYSRPHSEHFSAAYNMFLAKPLTGYGPKTFRKVCKYPEFNKNFLTCSTHPHNIYLQLLSETGIFVFLIFLYFFILSSYRLIILYLNKNKKNDIYYFKFYTSLGLFINLFPLSTSGNLFNNWFSILLFFVFSFFLVSNNVKNIK